MSGYFRSKCVRFECPGALGPGVLGLVVCYPT